MDIPEKHQKCLRRILAPAQLGVLFRVTTELHYDGFSDLPQRGLFEK